ncbi:MAG TPA: nuclear transport factor 2 family protein [Opitutaceae bacterium]|nr:nuclear transport factor 2 family protein [Opitutaceae bacterium]
MVVVIAASLSHGQTNQNETAPRPECRKAEQALQTLEQEWANAVKHRDVAKIDQIQAEEFMFTDPAGRVWTKAQALKTVGSGSLIIDSFELSDLNVRIYGTAAVVTFRVVWNGRSNGVDISGPQRMTDVFVQRDGRWQCVASQTTRIPSPPADEAR